jgi:hypothetical protein
MFFSACRALATRQKKMAKGTKGTKGTKTNGTAQSRKGAARKRTSKEQPAAETARKPAVRRTPAERAAAFAARYGAERERTGVACFGDFQHAVAAAVGPGVSVSDEAVCAGARWLEAVVRRWHNEMAHVQQEMPDASVDEVAARALARLHAAGVLPAVALTSTTVGDDGVPAVVQERIDAHRTQRAARRVARARDEALLAKLHVEPTTLDQARRCTAYVERVGKMKAKAEAMQEAYTEVTRAAARLGVPLGDVLARVK